MKKLSLFLLGCFATSFMSAQDITADLFTTLANTGANMTVGVNASKFDQFEGGQIGAFFDLNGDGALSCVGLETIDPGFFGVALWGDDSSTPEADGLSSGAAPSFAILHDGNVILVDVIPQFTGYVTNGIVNITDAGLSIESPNTGFCGNLTSCIYNPIPYENVSYIEDCGYYGCTDNTYLEYDPLASCFDTDLCVNLIVYGCNDIEADNYDLYANIDDNSCIYFGCDDPSMFNYDPQANVNDGSCYPVIYGCTITYAQNFIPLTGDLFIDPNTNDGTCIVYGCTYEWMFNFDEYATDDDGSCYPYIYGCIDSTAYNFVVLSGDVYIDVNSDNGTCYPFIYGCVDSTASNYIEPIGDSNIDTNTDDESCYWLGCMYSWAGNFDPIATVDDGTCLPYLEGCTFEWADNYNEYATHEDDTCIRFGCMNPEAENYDSEAIFDDGSCLFIDYSCDPTIAVLSYDFINTGSNMTVFLTPNAISTVPLSLGDTIGAFYEDAYGNYNSCGYELWTNNPLIIATWGDDSSTPEKDGLSSGETVVFMATTQSEVIYRLYPQTTISYVTNGIYNVIEFSYEESGTCNLISHNYGCTDALACNYNPNSNIEDNSCEYILEFYDCEGLCLLDSDDDGVCDELEVVGCQEVTYVHYDSLATDAGPCDITWHEHEQILELQIDSLEYEIENNTCAPIPITLLQGWNIIAFTIDEPRDLIESFYPIESYLHIVKNNDGDIYMPEYGFNGIGPLLPGQGYQVRMFDFVNAFYFE